MSFASWLRSKKHAPIRRRTFSPRLELLEDRLTPATFAVVNTADSGLGSLRQAILDANANLGDDVINFNIGGGGVQTIAPTSALPTITDPVTIDGTTQPGFVGSPIIELNGAGAGFTHGLSITAGNSTVRSLVINRFSVDRAGVNLEGPGAVGNRVQGCYIGTDVSGTVPLGNFDGVRLRSGPKQNIIGTDGDGINDLAERNIISGNARLGVQIAGAGSDNNVVAGNYIGTDVTGTVALSNKQGQQGAEIVLGARGNRIGTDGNGVADVAERNLISGNFGFGVRISSDSANPVTTGNTVAGNYIGTQEDGTSALGNARGINMFGGVQGNQIGGITAAMGNTIAFNREAGVQVIDVVNTPSNTGNRIQGNSIHSNGRLGIDLSADGVTPNDLGDADTGPNDLQNFPVITVAHSGPKTFVAGTLNSLPDTMFTLDFYASSAADPSGYGEGERYLGSWTGYTVGNGLSFEVLLDAATTAGEVITATATEEPTGNTSEFSAALLVTDLVIDGSNPDTAGDNDYLFTAHGTGAIQVFFQGDFMGAAAQVVVADPAGSDSYTVDFGGWQGVITITDLGTSGTDSLTTNGTAGDDVIVKIADQITFGNPVMETVNYTGIENVIVDGGDGSDTITDPGENTTILGGNGDDTIIIDGTFGNGVVIDGGEGSDDYVVLFGNLAGPVIVADSGTTGTDSLTVQGTSGNDSITLTGNEVQNGAETIILSSPIADLTVEGGGGSDSTTIDSFSASLSTLTVDGSGGTNTVSVVGDPPPGVTLNLIAAVQSVNIDIVPRPINLASHGFIPVVLYTTATFDAALVDVTTVLFAGAHATRSYLADVDGDGDLDLVLHFRTQDTNLLDVFRQLLIDADQEIDGRLDPGVPTRQTARMSLTGKTLSGAAFEGFDELELFLAGTHLRDMLRELAAAGLI